MTSIKRNWEKFALLLIDVQRDFWSEQVAGSFPDFPANVDRLLALCRNEGMEIVHLRGCYETDKSDWMLRYRLRGKIACVEGTEGIETLPFAIKKPGEAVFVKQTFDGFLNQDLLPYLRKKGKRFLLTAGLATSYCVFLTTASAAQLGFLTAIVEDCCADEPFIHEVILERYWKSVFDRTTSDSIYKDYSKWLLELEKVKEVPAT